jgi:hypothetical protein
MSEIVFIVCVTCVLSVQGKCAELVSAATDGELLGIYLLTSINHWNVEQVITRLDNAT